MNDENGTKAINAGTLPKRHEVHTGSAAKPCSDIPEGMRRKPVDEKSAAEWAYERLIMYITDFEKTLDNEHEVAMGFAGGDAGVLRIEGVGYFEPDIITFYGADAAGAKTQLVQHVSQLSVLLRALPKQTPQEEPRRIGFQLVQDLENA